LLKDRKEYKKATAYYERVYVSYGKYKNLVAEAYLRRAACLEAMGRKEDAVETLLDMIQRPDMKDRSEERQALRVLGILDKDWEQKRDLRQAALEAAQKQASDPPPAPAQEGTAP
jgi:tetratricopeptide (TPR) repeat protein